MNELIRVEENTLIVAQKAIEQIKEIEKNKKLLEEQEQEFKTQLLKAMEEYNIKSWEAPDKSIQITYVPESLSVLFDSKAFRDYDFETWQKFTKDSIRKASIRMTIREENKE